MLVSCSYLRNRSAATCALRLDTCDVFLLKIKPDRHEWLAWSLRVSASHDALSKQPGQTSSHPSAQEPDAVSRLLQDCTRMLTCRPPCQKMLVSLRQPFKAAPRRRRARQMVVREDLTFASHQRSAAAGPAVCLLSPPHAPLSFVPVRREMHVRPSFIQDVVSR